MTWHSPTSMATKRIKTKKNPCMWANYSLAITCCCCVCWFSVFFLWINLEKPGAKIINVNHIAEKKGWQNCGGELGRAKDFAQCWKLHIKLFWFQVFRTQKSRGVMQIPQLRSGANEMLLIVLGNKFSCMNRNAVGDSEWNLSDWRHRRTASYPH